MDKVYSLMALGENKITVDWLAGQACLSPRQFERSCQQYLGIGPRSFSRLARFHKAYELKVNHSDYSWLRIAMDCGYHDYQHLSKDFLEYTQALPNQFFKEDEKAPGRLLGFRK